MNAALGKLEEIDYIYRAINGKMGVLFCKNWMFILENRVVFFSQFKKGIRLLKNYNTFKLQLYN